MVGAEIGSCRKALRMLSLDDLRLGVQRLLIGVEFPSDVNFFGPTCRLYPQALAECPIESAWRRPWTNYLSNNTDGPARIETW